MSPKIRAALAVGCFFCAVGSGRADTTISTSNSERFAYGANVGWINLGDRSPVNGIQYGNALAGDHGVNHDGLGTGTVL